MFVAPESGKLLLVTANTFQLVTVIALTLIAGLTMMLAGAQKKMLRSKKATDRCPTCGRTDRYNCPCRR
jgi:hypothetical protein